MVVIEMERSKLPPSVRVQMLEAPPAQETKSGISEPGWAMDIWNLDLPPGEHPVMKRPNWREAYGINQTAIP